MDEKPPPRRFSLPRLSVTAISMTIAALSLFSSISQSYNYRKNIEAVQQNVLRGENLKTCRDLIEVFFAFRLKAEESNAVSIERAPDAMAAAQMRREMKSLVYRFGALGTYLANFAPESARERYAKLSWQLNALADTALSLKPVEFSSTFAEADKAFATLNDDCAKSAQLLQ